MTILVVIIKYIILVNLIISLLTLVEVIRIVINFSYKKVILKKEFIVIQRPSYYEDRGFVLNIAFIIAASAYIIVYKCVKLLFTPRDGAYLNGVGRTQGVLRVLILQIPNILISFLTGIPVRVVRVIKAGYNSKVSITTPFAAALHENIKGRVVVYAFGEYQVNPGKNLKAEACESVSVMAKYLKDSSISKSYQALSYSDKKVFVSTVEYHERVSNEIKSGTLEEGAANWISQGVRTGPTISRPVGPGLYKVLNLMPVKWELPFELRTQSIEKTHHYANNYNISGKAIFHPVQFLKTRVAESPAFQGHITGYAGKPLGADLNHTAIPGLQCDVHGTGSRQHVVSFMTHNLSSNYRLPDNKTIDAGRADLQTWRFPSPIQPKRLITGQADLGILPVESFFSKSTNFNLGTQGGFSVEKNLIEELCGGFEQLDSPSQKLLINSGSVSLSAPKIPKQALYYMRHASEMYSIVAEEEGICKFPKFRLFSDAEEWAFNELSETFFDKYQTLGLGKKEAALLYLINSNNPENTLDSIYSEIFDFDWD